MDDAFEFTTSTVPSHIRAHTDVRDGGFVWLYDFYPDLRLRDDVFVSVDPDTGGSALDWEIVASARVSFDGSLKGPGQDARLLEYLIKHHHDSPLEMVDVTFVVNAPLVVWWQWVRHRVGFSYNFQSGRYTEFDDTQLHVPMPSEWRKQSSFNKQASDGYFSSLEGAEFSDDMLKVWQMSYGIYVKMLNAGVAKEQARLVLPAFGLYYKARVKATLRAWLHFIELRDHPHAQQEIRDYAVAIRNQLEILTPLTLKLYKKHRIP